MGTRSLTYVFRTYKIEDGNRVDQPIVSLYRQFDGYPEGHGAELANFLTSGTMVNGLGYNETRRVFNGIGCMAAQMVSHFKKDNAGGFYLEPPEPGLDAWQEYEYWVYEDKVIVYSVRHPENQKLFEGTWAEFRTFCNGRDELFETDNPDSVEYVKQALRGGEVEITFEKKDGSTRVMRATLDEGKIPEASLPKTPGTTRAANDEVQPVFDLDEQHWKSFRWDSLKSFKVA